MPVEDLWAMVRDPHHLPRWWPRVTRVEDVDATAFTEVMRTKKGKLVRADFDVVSVDEAQRVLVWSQRIEDTPFAQVLSASETELRLASAPSGTEVTIELRQTLVKRSPIGALGALSFSRGVGSHMVRRAAKATIDEALDGLERIGG